MEESERRILLTTSLKDQGIRIQEEDQLDAMIVFLLWASATMCTADTSLTSQQQAHMRQLALQIFPSSVVDNWHMDNPGLANMIIAAVKSLTRCDHAMKKVHKLMNDLTFSTLSKYVKPIVKHLMAMKEAGSGMSTVHILSDEL
ncbi:unnamed protein product, partial [Rotaria sp. Silwood2]